MYLLRSWGVNKSSLFTLFLIQNFNAKTPFFRNIFLKLNTEKASKKKEISIFETNFLDQKSTKSKWFWKNQSRLFNKYKNLNIKQCEKLVLLTPQDFYFITTLFYLDISNFKDFNFYLFQIMCTIICTVRTVLWYVMSIAGTLLILIALFTNTWLEGQLSTTNVLSGARKSNFLPLFCQNNRIGSKKKSYKFIKTKFVVGSGEQHYIPLFSTDPIVTTKYQQKNISSNWFKYLKNKIWNLLSDPVKRI